MAVGENHATTQSLSVLVVDDDDLVRGFARKVLHRGGYTVLEAADPDEALRFAEDHRGPIHLLLTDIAMPWMRGTDLFRRFAPLHPEARVIYMSGYTPDTIGQGEVMAPGEFIQKPFNAGDLIDKVREVLDR